MHQTTVRFGPDLWEALETECRQLGVSAAQYLREAALARLAYTAGRLGSPRYEVALADAGAKAIVREVAVDADPVMSRSERTQAAAAAAAAAAATMADDETSSSEALKAQSALVLARSRVLRERSERIRGGRPVRTQ